MDRLQLFLPVVLVLTLIAPRAAPAQVRDDRVGLLLIQLEKVLESGDAAGYLQLLAPLADRASAESFATTNIQPGVGRAVVRERDRAPLAGTLPGDGHQLSLEVFTESGARGRVAAWTLDVRRIGSAAGGEWGIVRQESVTALDGLHRLSLRHDREFVVRNATITGEDLTLKLLEGSVFVAESGEGVTGLVFLGRGEMTFKPAPATEQGQIKLWTGSELLEDRFDSAFVRLNPADYEARVTTASFVPRRPDPKRWARAETVFRAQGGRSFVLDLGDLSRDTWSLIPASGDFLADIRTSRFRTLTYTRSWSEPEDITLFDRDRRINLSVYASQEKLQSRGRFYTEDEDAEIDIIDQTIEASFAPARQWIDGLAQMRVRVRAFAIGTLRLRLADSLVVQRITTDKFGRVLHLRVRGQNSVLIPLPSALRRDHELTLWVSYGGRLSPQTIDREALQVEQPEPEAPVIQPEPSFLYSNRSFWYPQSEVSDYATATLKLAVPLAYGCVASGELHGPPTVVDGGRATEGKEPRKLYVFKASRPLRYLACVISRFRRVDTFVVSIPKSSSEQAEIDGNGASQGNLNLTVEANPRQIGRGRDLGEKTQQVIQFFSSLVGEYPYPSFTLALTESNLPGGHSPAYFAALHQPLPTTPFTWHNDPASFRGQPLFFLAHELAHQWWGQAVGWKNYHEQWLSEGFAQYFAALFVRETRGEEAFGEVLRQFRRWAIERSDQGPVYLGYRLGHVKRDSRVFRALVYNKGAAVIHMLRLWVGEEAFFRGLRRFYSEWRFQKAGTDDLRRVFEAQSGLSLDRFFERWVHGASIPRVTYSQRLDKAEGAQVLHVTFRQNGEVFDLPVSVTLTYVDRAPETFLTKLTSEVQEQRLVLSGTLRGVELNKDGSSLAEFVRR